MAASSTLPQGSLSRKSPIGKTGVITLSGFGIKVRMQSGHLEIEDGIGPERRKIRLARVGHGLKRLVCLSEDGFITLDALNWLSGIGASFVFLHRRGHVRFVTGPTSPYDSRLRRTQALALYNGLGLKICRVLIDAKLQRQEHVIREQIKDAVTADVIARFRSHDLPQAETFERIRTIEAHAAASYFAALRNIPLMWPKAERRIPPDHWLAVGSRQSPLSGGPRLAVTPFHAMENYCAALLESESRLAVSAVGLLPDLGLGLHTDRPNRDSLVYDVCEPVRPQLESWLIRWVLSEPLQRRDFFETGAGHVRLTSSFAAKLSETAPTWGRLVAPWAEYVARTLWASASPSKGARRFPTHLTQSHRRQAKGQAALPSVRTPRPEKVCHGCGAVLSSSQGKHCALCGVSISRANMIELARRGRVAAKSAESRARMSAS